MVNSKGLRRGTRHTFARGFRNHGTEHLSTYLRVYKVGDFVDVKGNGAFQKGMPFKFYHGKTGKVFNVTKRSLGVVINKRVGNRLIPKRIHVRIEHCHPSKCREGFLKRVKENEARRKAGLPVLKRVPYGPRPAHFTRGKDVVPELVEPIPYEFIA